MGLQKKQQLFVSRQFELWCPNLQPYFPTLLFFSFQNEIKKTQKRGKIELFEEGTKKYLMIFHFQNYEISNLILKKYINSHENSWKWIKVSCQGNFCPSSVRFLGEVMARQFCFEIYWPLTLSFQCQYCSKTIGKVFFLLFYSCNKITTTQIKIYRQN